MAADEQATYVADISGSVGIRANDYETYIPSKIYVSSSIDPVAKYIGDIVGLTELVPTGIYDEGSGLDPTKTEIQSTLNVTLKEYDLPNGVITCYTNLVYDVGQVDIRSGLIVAQRTTDYDILEGELDYQKEYLDVNILSSMDVIIREDNDIDGFVDIQNELYSRDINSFIEVKDVAYLKDAIEGSAYLGTSGYSIKLADGKFVYEQDQSESFLDGSVIINDFNSWFDVNCRINVPCHRVLYSFLCKMKAVNECTIDIPSEITVFNDQIYDILGDLNLQQEVYDDLVLEGTMNLPPYYYCDIQSTVNMDPIYTRRDFDCYMYATTPVNTDIDFTMNVITQYTNLIQDIDSTMNVGDLVNIDIRSEITTEAALQTNNEIVSRINVTNDLIPARVGFFVDPLWNYQPFVLKNAVSTFFDRILDKAEVSIVFSGSPRANWDIRHFADVYRILKYHQHEVPFEFIPTHPLSNRDSMYRYINALFTFPKHSKVKTVDRVFVFSDNTYTHNSTYLSPLYKVCADHHIPITVITSKGEFTGTDPASPSRFIARNPIDPNIPMDRQPHWVFGAGTKHRDIFDDHPIV